MALIVEYHVVADMYPVGATAISAGMNVTLVAGLVVPATANVAVAIDIAGDSRLSAAGQTTAYSDQLTIGASGGGSRWTENRVSDFYDETLASQKITVYNGGGKFWISEDLFDAPAAIVALNLLQTGATAGFYATGAGTGPNDHIATVVGASQAYPSGVPGTDVTGSITLGNYIPIILRI